MGVGSGTGGITQSKAISITNHTGDPIELTTVSDNADSEGNRKVTRTIGAKDTYVLFTDKVEAFAWSRAK